MNYEKDQIMIGRRKGYLSVALMLAVNLCACSDAGDSKTAAQDRTPPGGTTAAAAVTFASDPCEAMFDAMIAQAKVPFASDMTSSGGAGSPLKSESRSVGGKSYYQVDGAWHFLPMTINQMVADLIQARKTAQQTCTLAGEEKVNGEPVKIFAAHLVNQGGASDNKLWVSERSGLPLRAESHSEEGTTVLQTFRYENIEAPNG